MNDPVFAAAGELAAIRDRRVSSAEVLDAHLGQITRHNPSINAVVTLAEEGSRRKAREADEALARGERWGPLHGVPVTVKDSLETAGLRAALAVEGSGLEAREGPLGSGGLIRSDDTNRSGPIVFRSCDRRSRMGPGNRGA